MTSSDCLSLCCDYLSVFCKGKVENVLACFVTISACFVRAKLRMSACFVTISACFVRAELRMS